MKLILFVILLGLGVVGLSSAVPIVEAQTRCGLKPLKPLVPLGCGDLVAQCLCDRRGRNCEWTWVCVKRGR